MKKLLMIFLVGIFLMSMASAYTKTYDQANEEILIESNAGVDLLRIKLISNTYICGTECEAVLRIDVLKDGLSAPFSPFVIRKKIQNTWVSGTIKSLKFQHNTSGSWNALNINQFNTGLANSGTYYVKLLGEKEAGETVDWIPSMFGNELLLDEWALWMGTDGLVSYYKLDESSGPVLDELDLFNGTNDGATRGVTGILNDAFDFDGINDNVNLPIARTFSNISISFWMDWDDVGTSNTQMIFEGDVSSRITIHTGGGAGTNGIRWSLQGAGGNLDTTGIISSGFQHYVVTYDGTNASIYKNGTLFNSVAISWTPQTVASIFMGARGGSSLFFDGTLDEVYISNKSLTASEVLELYNGGNAEPFGSLQVTANSPTDNFRTVNGSVIFDITSSTSLGVLENITLFLNGSLNETKIISGNLDTTTFAKGFALGSYNWSALVCTNESICKSSDVRAFTIEKVIINSNTYNVTAYDTSQESFIVNVSANASLTNVQLVYDGTTYGTTQAGNIYTRTLQIPAVSSEENKTFNWKFTYGGDTINSDLFNQTVNPTIFTLCDGTYTTAFINYTFKDEGDLSETTGQFTSAEFIYWLGSGTVNKTYNFINNTNNTAYTFCVSPTDRSLNVNPYIQYKNDVAPQRIYDAEATTLTNVTTNQTLYLLNNNDGIYVTFQTINTAQQTLPGVVVNATRVISSETVLVGQGITDNAGSVTFWLNPDFLHLVGFSKTGYVTASTSLVPTQPIYTITLSQSGVTTDDDYTRGISYLVKPQDGWLFENTIHEFNFSLTSLFWDLDSFAFNLSYGNGTLIGQNSSTASTGGFLSLSNINISNGTSIVMQPYYVINGTTTLINLPRIWRIQEIEGTEYSIWNFFKNLNTSIDGGLFGMGNFGKTLLAVILLVVTIGGLSHRYGLRNDATMTGAIFAMVFLLELGLDFIPEITIPATGVTLPKGILTAITFIILIAVLIAEERR